MSRAEGSGMEWHIRIEEIDKNLVVETDIAEPDILWLDVKEAPFVIHGVQYDEKRGMSIIIPSFRPWACAPAIPLPSPRTARSCSPAMAGIPVRWTEPIRMIWDFTAWRSGLGKKLRKWCEADFFV